MPPREETRGTLTAWQGGSPGPVWFPAHQAVGVPYYPAGMYISPSHSAPLSPPERGKGCLGHLLPVWPGWKSSSSLGLWWPRGVTIFSCGIWPEHSDHLRDCCLVDLSFSWYFGQRERALCETLFLVLSVPIDVPGLLASLTGVPFPLRSPYFTYSPGESTYTPPSQKWKSRRFPFDLHHSRKSLLHCSTFRFGKLLLL